VDLHDPLQIRSGRRPSSAIVAQHCDYLGAYASDVAGWRDRASTGTSQLNHIQNILLNASVNDSVVDGMLRSIDGFHRLRSHGEAYGYRVEQALRRAVGEGRSIADAMAGVERRINELVATVSRQQRHYAEIAVFENIPIVSDVEAQLRRDVHTAKIALAATKSQLADLVEAHDSHTTRWNKHLRSMVEVIRDYIADPAKIAGWTGRKLDLTDGKGQLWSANQPIAVTDVLQGSVGDCWFACVIAGLANTEAGRATIARMIHDNGDGTFTVTFPSGQVVTVDGEVYTGPDGKPIASRIPPSGNYWYLILEKAYATFHRNSDAARAGESGYQAMVGGVQMRILTDLGLATNIVQANQVKDGRVTAPMARDDLMRFCDQANDGGVVTLSVDKSVVGEAHGFTVVRTDHTKNPPQVILRNPWGNNGPGWFETHFAGESPLPLWKGAHDLGNGYISVPIDSLVPTVMSGQAGTLTA